MTVDRREATSLLPGIHERAGARFREGEASPAWPRHYGDPSAEYRAAVDSCAVVDRTHRNRWKIGGRDPARMLNGIVTNTIPEHPAPVQNEGIGDGESADGDSPGTLYRGLAPYGVTLTAKGKMISDHRLLRMAGPDADAFLLDIPAAGIAGMQAHFDRFLPPRFAEVEDVSASTGMLTVVGPGAADALAYALDLGGEAFDLAELLEQSEEGEYFLLPRSGPESGADTPEGRIRVLRSGDLGSHESNAPPAFDVMASRGTLVSLWDRLAGAECRPMGRAAWETLRVEGGRPAFGADMDENTIPVEAGVHDRAIDYQKGCYTGQEVIVRIRDLGRVNRHLRRLLLGDGPVPARGTELFRADGGREVGRVTSAVDSPRFGRVIGLGYVRREVGMPGEVRLGSAEGPLIEVRPLPTESAESGEDGAAPG
ncbi:MAG: glycine cleavage T C-terminal barrel domain-containing protein [Longimicrobiales bacterium]|nr:glycine cleavage T C-terminal barrel domain-containing protein [Longimicrobiales bacterium]